MLAMTCLAVGFTSLAPQLAYDRQGIVAGEVWRLWTGHLTHFSAQQLWVNVSVLLVVGWLVEREWGARFTAGILLLGMPAISIGLFFLSPHLLQYRGASAVVMLLALAAASAMWQSRPAARLGLLLIGLALATKTLFDVTGTLPDLSSLPPGIRVAWQAHVAGALIGWLASRHHLRRNDHSRMPRS
jgi:rhomboid family GlyGly-CTERM serine protease